MNDRRYRDPARPSPPNAPPRGSRERWDGPPSEFEEDYSPRPPRRTRDFGSAPDQRPPHGPSGPVQPRQPRVRDDGAPGLEGRPPRSSRDLGMPPRGPRYPDAERPERLERPERPRRSMDRLDGREARPSRPGFDDAPGTRPRRPRPPDGQPRRKRGSSRRKKLHTRYRYLALVGIMLFAAAGGISLGFSDIGGHNVSIGLILLAIPALLVGVGCAAAYVYF